MDSSFVCPTPVIKLHVMYMHNECTATCQIYGKSPEHKATALAFFRWLALCGFQKIIDDRRYM